MSRLLPPPPRSDQQHCRPTCVSGLTSGPTGAPVSPVPTWQTVPGGPGRDGTPVLPPWCQPCAHSSRSHVGLSDGCFCGVSGWVTPFIRKDLHNPRCCLGEVSSLTSPALHGKRQQHHIGSSCHRSHHTTASQDSRASPSHLGPTLQRSQMSRVKKTEAANGSPSVTPTQMHTCGQGTQTWGVMQHTKTHTKKARHVHICTRIAARLLQDPQTDDRQISAHIHKAAATAAVHECRRTGRPPGGPNSYGISVLKTWDSQSSWYPWALELPATCFSGQCTQAHPGARQLCHPLPA